MLRVGFKHYWRDSWNKFDQAMYIILLVAVILRFTLTNDDFIWARYFYAVNLVMFWLRTLQLYYFHEHLGPKVLVIGRMVCIVSDTVTRQYNL